MTVKSSLHFFFAFVLSLFLVEKGLAQEKHPETQATNPDMEIKKNKEGPKKRVLLSLIKNNTKGILYGNRCFEEFTQKCGYEYVVQPKGISRNRNELSRWFHNFGVKFIITFRNGPFWKLKEKKKKKECRAKTGDFVGS